MKSDYYNQGELASLTEIPIEHIRVSRECGFKVSHNKWFKDEYVAWYAQNKNKITDYLFEQEDDNSPDVSDSGEKLKHERFLIAQIERKAMEGKTLNKDKVLAIARGVLDAQSIILHTRKQELALKLVGKDANYIAKEIGISDEKFLSILREQIKKWIEEKKVV